jgi:hypothetical protein
MDPKRTSGHASSCKRKGYSLNAVLQKYHRSATPNRIAPSLVLRPMAGAPQKKALP